MRPEIESAVIISVDLIAGFLVIGAAWWLFSIYQSSGAAPAGTKPQAETLTGAQPSDDSAQAGDAGVVTTAQVAELAGLQNPGYYNPARF